MLSQVPVVFLFGETQAPKFQKNLQWDAMDLHHHNPVVLHDLNRFNLMHVLSSWEFLSIYPNLPINYHLKIWGPLVHSCSLNVACSTG